MDEALIRAALQSILSVSPSGLPRYLSIDNSSVQPGTYNGQPGFVVIVTVTIAQSDEASAVARLLSASLLATLRSLGLPRTTVVAFLPQPPPPQLLPVALSPAPALSRSSLAVIIGCSVGGAVLLAGLVLGWLAWRRRTVPPVAAPKALRTGVTRGAALLQAGAVRGTPVTPGQGVMQPAGGHVRGWDAQSFSAGAEQWHTAPARRPFYT